MSTLHSSSNCILRSVVTRECWEKAKILTCLADLPTHAPTTFASPWHHQFAPWLQVWQLAICIPKWASGWPGVMSLAPSAPQRKQRLWESLFETAISDRVYPNGNFVQHSSFFFLLQLCLCFPFFFFLPPSSRRCITSARPCLMTYFFGWLWITVSAESSNLERRHSGVARKATYVSPPVNLPELHFCSLESCPNINMMCQPCKWT